MKKLYILLLLNFISFSSNAQEEGIKNFTTQAFSLGSSLTFFSPTLNENRTINVYLPSSYKNDPLKSYPVIYLLDGSADEDFIHITGLVQFATFSWAQLIPESIVIGISNVDRKRDFTYPTQNVKDKAQFPTTGGSAHFISFIANELQAFVAKEFRVTEERTLIGQSLGGLLATEILWTQPQLFSNYIIVSPSLWWDDFSLLSRKRNLQKSPTKVFIAVGQEGPTMEGPAMGLAAALKRDDTMQTHFKYLEDLDHTNTLHQAVYEAFKVLYTKEKQANHD